MRPLILIGISMAGSSPAHPASQPLTGAAIYAMCRDHTEGSLGDSVCDGYVEGYIEGMDAAKISAQVGHPICIPENVSGLQVRAAIEWYLATTPDALTRDAATMVAVALAKAYPCTGK